jgi:hypothetical protein
MTRIMGLCTKINEQKHNRLEKPGDKVSVEPTAVVAVSLLLCLMSQESLFFTVDHVLSSVKVGFVGLHHLGLHEELVAKDTDQVNRDTLTK